MATSKDLSRSVVGASDELRDIYCELCVYAGKQNEAEGFCLDCSEYLCGPCYRNHIRYKAFKQHVLQDKDHMPLYVAKACAKDVIVEKCSIHTTIDVEYFCQSCDTLACHICITINHRQCEDVDHIPNIVKDIEKSEEFKEFTNVLMVLDKKLETVGKERKKTLYSNSTEIDVMKGKAKTILTQQRYKIKLFFDQLEADMKKKIEDLDSENQETLTAETSAYDSVKDDLETIKTDIKTKLKDGQKKELFIAMKNAKPKAQKLINEIAKLSQRSRIQSFVLAPSPQIKKVMGNTSEICRFVLSSKYLDKINVGTKKDNKTPWIIDLVIIQDQYLALTDNANKSIKTVDTRSMSVKSETNLNCIDIWSIASMGDDKIAINIVSRNGSQVQIISVSKQGSLRKGPLMNIGGFCYGLAYSRGNIFILQDKQVEIIDMQGKIQETIKTDFSICRRGGIAVSPDNETIYITNPQENSVTSMTLGGRVKAIYKDLENPCSIIIDKDGMVYVSGYYCIHLLTEDLIKVQVIEEGVYGECITYSSTDSRLYVGRMDLIKVYEIER